MSVRPLNIFEPYLYITNVVSQPISSPARNGESQPLLGFYGGVLTLGILLERYIDTIEKGRSLGDDQVGVYEAVADKLETQFGLDGRACVLRFICELQQRHLGRNSMAGKILTALFTPRVKEVEGHLYLAAKGLGRRKDAECVSHYGSCPHSVFLYFDTLRNLTTTTTT